MEQDKKLSTDVMSKGVDPVSFFDKDESFVLAYKKTEKLASAVYMVTSLFSDQEPMKWSLRKKVGELVSFILAYKDTPKSAESDFVYNAKTKVLEVVSLLEISSRGGLVSQMNFNILKQEFLNLLEIFATTENGPQEMFSHDLSKTFFDLPQHEVLGRQIVAPTHTREPFALPQNKVSHGQIKDKPSHFPEDEKKVSRQNVILSLLRKKKEITIKDVSHIIKDCSEKTIQRELMAFIASGVLQKTGERRWSKYSLVNQA